MELQLTQEQYQSFLECDSQIKQLAERLNGDDAFRNDLATKWKTMLTDLASKLNGFDFEARVVEWQKTTGKRFDVAIVAPFLLARDAFRACLVSPSFLGIWSINTGSHENFRSLVDVCDENLNATNLEEFNPDQSRYINYVSLWFVTILLLDTIPQIKAEHRSTFEALVKVVQRLPRQVIIDTIGRIIAWDQEPAKLAYAQYIMKKMDSDLFDDVIRPTAHTGLFELYFDCLNFAQFCDVFSKLEVPERD